MHSTLISFNNFRGYFGTSDTACIPIHRGTFPIAQHYPVLSHAITTSTISLIHQIHGNSGVFLSQQSSIVTKTQGDFIISQSSDHAIGIWTADCLPVFVYAQDTIACVHIGWRGALNGILNNVIQQLINYCCPSNMHFFLGPSAQGCCYAIGTKLASTIFDKFPTTKSLSTKNTIHYFDLKTLIVEQLSAISLLINVDQRCTICQPSFYSYRNNVKTPLRQMNACWLI